MAQSKKDIDVKEDITNDDAVAARRTQLHKAKAMNQTSLQKYIIAAHGLGIRSLSLDG
jgi:hypothetical protein